MAREPTEDEDSLVHQMFVKTHECLKQAARMNIPEPVAWLVSPKLYRLACRFINTRALTPLEDTDQGGPVHHYGRAKAADAWEQAMDEVLLYIHMKPVLVAAVPGIEPLYSPSVHALLLNKSAGGWKQYDAGLREGIAQAFKAGYSGRHGIRKKTQNETEHGEAGGGRSSPLLKQQQVGQREEQPEASPDREAGANNGAPPERKRPPSIGRPAKK